MRRRPAPAGPSEPEPGTVVLRAAGIVVARGGRRLLDDVDVTVRAGELVAVVGPNGAGKSTLLGVLAGDVAPDGGTVQLHGHELSIWDGLDLARHRAVLPQHTAVGFPFTVGDIVSMGRAPWARTTNPDRDAAIVADAVARTEVADLLARTFPTLSGGERARVALARVLAQRTGVLLLDEPTAALDLRHQELVLGVAQERVAEGAAVVAVLHDLGLAAAYADRVVVLHRGRVVAAGPPASVLAPPLLEDVYGCPIDVVPHPVGGAPLVVPRRTAPPRERTQA